MSLRAVTCEALTDRITSFAVTGSPLENVHTTQTEAFCGTQYLIQVLKLTVV